MMYGYLHSTLSQLALMLVSGTVCAVPIFQNTVTRFFRLSMAQPSLADLRLLCSQAIALLLLTISPRTCPMHFVDAVPHGVPTLAKN